MGMGHLVADSQTVPAADQLLIGGEWVMPAGRELVEAVSASTGEMVGRFPDPTQEDADRAVAAARRAFDEGPWPRMPVDQRIIHIRRFCDEVEARMEDLNVAWTTECGATVPFRQAMNIGVGKGSWDDFLERAAATDFTEIRDGGKWGPVEIRREPIGVVLNVLTYNGPVAHIGLKVVPALLAGCPVIVKPAPDTQLVAHLLSDAAANADLPHGVISVLAAGNEVSDYLVRHAGIDMVNFTGGTAIGARIMAHCAERIAKCTLELGGKSAGIVADDMDVDELMPLMLSGMLTFQGQICTALTRILVSNERHDEVVEALVDAFEAQKVGDPHDPETEWGPLAVERARDRVEAFTKTGLREGATLATGGRRPEGFDRGWYFEPTLFVDVKSPMTIAQDEIFGPIFSVIRYHDIDDAIRIANDTKFGLAGSVFTRDRETAMKVAHGVRSGTFAINGTGVCLVQPFGGVKQSGIGRECGVEGLLEFTEIKTTVLSDMAP